MSRARKAAILIGLGLLASPARAGSATGDTVNSLIDNLLATGIRLLEFPLFMLLCIAGLFGLVIAIVLRRVLKRHDSLRRTVLWVFVAFIVVSAVLIADRRMSRMQGEISELRSKMSSDAIARLDAAPPRSTKRESLMFDAAAVQKTLADKGFQGVTFRPAIYDAATDIVQIHVKSPLTQAYLAVIDLSDPDIEIKFGVNLDRKTLTSAFARENDCSVAINGEAGVSPDPDSGLGDWGGNMVYRGKVILREDENFAKPYLSFDRQNHASFVASNSPSSGLSPDAYNVIWGRLDSIIDGVVQTADARSRQPRTAMGVSADGRRLYLLVVDGRQPRYSMGFTRAEVGEMLKAFGAHNAMLCDEGGSSCMYFKDFGGICNIPSDNQGEERPTYTHFGVTLRDGRNSVVPVSAASAPAGH